MNFIYNLEPRFVSLTFKIKEAFLMFINKLEIEENIIRAAITFIKVYKQCYIRFLLSL